MSTSRLDFSDFVLRRASRLAGMLPLVFPRQTPPQWAGARLYLANEHVCCLTAARPHLLRLPTRLPSLFRPPPDNHAATSGELHSEGKCQSGAASPQSIPPETGAPHPSLLNISLLRLTPGKRGEMQPRMRVLPWGRRGRCCRATRLERGRRGKSFTGGDWLAAQLWPLHDGEKT